MPIATDVLVPSFARTLLGSMVISICSPESISILDRKFFYRSSLSSFVSFHPRYFGPIIQGGGGNSLPQNIHPPLGGPPSSLFTRYRGKRPRLEADHSPATTANVNKWSYTSIPHTCPTVWPGATLPCVSRHAYYQQALAQRILPPIRNVSIRLAELYLYLLFHLSKIQFQVSKLVTPLRKSGSQIALSIPGYVQQCLSSTQC